jgi:hypothetical protein
MKVTPYLKILAEKEGSDLYFSTAAGGGDAFDGLSLVEEPDEEEARFGDPNIDHAIRNDQTDVKLPEES